MKKIKLLLLLILLTLIVLVLFFAYSILTPISTEDKLVYFVIEPGQGFNQISNNLKAAGLVENQLIFETYVWLIDREDAFIAGEHQLNKKMTSRQLVRTLTSGSTVDSEIKITILEGWRCDQIGEYLASRGLATKEEFLAAIALERWQADYDFLADVETDKVEGFLFPDTYRVFADASVDQIIAKMLANFDQRLGDDLLAEIDRQGKTVFEIVNLASIVQKESPIDDMPMVADVFLKRLEAGIGLQSDATINYITGKKDLRPTLADLEIDSPYNTYKYRGLPPGPIASPGLAAIKAVVYPQANDYYYFLNSDGQTYFARTYQEHLENISRYLD